NEVYQLIVQQIDRRRFTQIMGELEYTGKENAALTVRISLPQKGDSWKWYRGLERSELMTGSVNFYDTVSVATVHPPDGAFNGNTLQDGGYGDPVGRGSMSFYPLAALNIDNKGKALGIDLSIPMVYRIGASAVKGLFAEFDIATSPLSEKFPNRAFFKLSYFDFDATWGM